MKELKSEELSSHCTTPDCVQVYIGVRRSAERGKTQLTRRHPKEEMEAAIEEESTLCPLRFCDSLL